MTHASTRLDSEQRPFLRATNAILAARRAIIGVALIAAILTIAVSLVLPRTYTTEVSIQPEERSISGSLTSLVAQFGASLPMPGAGQSPAFYAHLASSPAILGPVVEDTLEDSTINKTLEDYYDTKRGSPGLRRYEATKKFLHDLHVTLNAEAGLVQLEVTLKDAGLAFRAAQRLVAELNTYNLKTRQSRARAMRVFAQEQVTEAQGKLQDAEDSLRIFLNRNRGPLASPDLTFQEAGLQREIDLRQQVYLTLMQIYQQARLDEVRDTPVFTVVEPPVEAPRPDSRHILLKAVVAFVIGLGVTLMMVLVREGFTVESDTDTLARYLAVRNETAADMHHVWRLITLRHR